jgi:hypothetical protein
MSLWAGRRASVKDNKLDSSKSVNEPVASNFAFVVRWRIGGGLDLAQNKVSRLQTHRDVTKLFLTPRGNTAAGLHYRIQLK